MISGCCIFRRFLPKLGPCLSWPRFLASAETGFGAGKRRVALALGTLHEDGIDPAVELETGRSEGADLAESQGGVERDGSAVLGIADARHHLAATDSRATFDERAQ